MTRDQLRARWKAEAAENENELSFDEETEMLRRYEEDLLSDARSAIYSYANAVAEHGDDHPFTREASARLLHEAKRYGLQRFADGAELPPWNLTPEAKRLAREVALAERSAKRPGAARRGGRRRAA